MKEAEKDSLVGSLARTALEMVLALPAPALFTLVTLNSYSTSSTSPSTMTFVSKKKKKFASLIHEMQPKTEDVNTVNNTETRKPHRFNVY